jgi:hypothetical protein
MTCKARQYSDQMLCDSCGVQWDVNDPEPPTCAAEVATSANVPLFKEGDLVNVQPSATPFTGKGSAHVAKVGSTSDLPFGVPQYEVVWQNGDRAICGQSDLSPAEFHRRYEQTPVPVDEILDRYAVVSGTDIEKVSDADYPAPAHQPEQCETCGAIATRAIRGITGTGALGRWHFSCSAHS